MLISYSVRYNIVNICLIKTYCSCAPHSYTKTKAKKMLTTILPQIVTACAATVAATTYLATAKRTSPISHKDATILWKLHKQNASCNSEKMKPITMESGEIAGFQCQCGYCYAQKRPLLSRTPTIVTDANESGFQQSPSFSSARANSKSALK